MHRAHTHTKYEKNKKKKNIIMLCEYFGAVYASYTPYACHIPQHTHTRQENVINEYTTNINNNIVCIWILE